MSKRKLNRSPDKSQLQEIESSNINYPPQIGTNQNQFQPQYPPPQQQQQQQFQEENAFNDPDEIFNQAEEILQEQTAPTLLEDVRSDYVSQVDLHSLQQEKDLFFAYETNGIFGFDVKEAQKTSQYGQEGQQQAQIQSQLGFREKFLKDDGVHIITSGDTVKLNNLRRLEQRLVNTENNDYWKMNGELLMDDEWVDFKNCYIKTGIAGNSILQTYQRNAISSDRINQQKDIGYRLDLVIGKIQFTNHLDFSDQDKQTWKMLALIKKYQKQAQLSLIPETKQSIEQLKNQILKLQGMYNVPEDQVNQLEKQLEVKQEDLVTIKEYLQNIMNDIISLWKQIANMRTQYTTNVYNLGSEQHSFENGKKVETVFKIIQKPMELENYPPDEIKRQIKIKKQKVSVNIYVNNEKIAQSKLLPLGFGTYEIYAYTRPYKIEIEVVIHQGMFKKTLLPRVAIQIPGTNVQTLTSCAPIYDKAHFIQYPSQPKPSIKKNKKKKELPKELDSQIDDKEPLSKQSQENNLSQVEDEEKQPLVKQQSEQNTLYEGEILYMTAWVGSGTKMPPITQIAKEQTKETFSQKRLKEYLNKELQLSKSIHFDIRDPRFKDILSKLLKTDKQQQAVFLNDYLPFSDIMSKRHELILLRSRNPEINRLKMIIPLTEGEITMNEELMTILLREFQETLLIGSGENNDEFMTDFDKYPQSEETKQRLITVIRCLKERSRKSAIEKEQELGYFSDYNTVINEYNILSAASPIYDIIRGLFTQRRKLAPKRIVHERKQAHAVKEIMVYVQLIKGHNVPIRSSEVNIITNIQGRKSKQKEEAMQIDRTAPVGYGQMDNMNYPSQYQSQYPSQYPPSYSQPAIMAHHQFPGDAMMGNPVARKNVSKNIFFYFINQKQ